MCWEDLKEFGVLVFLSFCKAWVFICGLAGHDFCFLLVCFGTLSFSIHPIDLFMCFVSIALLSRTQLPHIRTSCLHADAQNSGNHPAYLDDADLCTNIRGWASLQASLIQGFLSVLTAVVKELAKSLLCSSSNFSGQAVDLICRLVDDPGLIVASEVLCNDDVGIAFEKGVEVEVV